MEESIAVFGLGKLGAALVAVLAEAGFSVRGVDVSLEAVESVLQAEPSTYEPGLADLLGENTDRIFATTDPAEGLRDTNLAYIIVPTPSDKQGSFDNSFVEHALREIALELRSNPRRYTVVIASTVMPGSCLGVFAPFLEEIAGLQVGREIGLVYSPEFIALGSVIRDMKYPDLVLIGASDEAAADLVEGVARKVVRNDPQIRRMSLPSAEVTKLAVNTFVTTKISFANMLSEICDALPGADIDDVTGAVGADSRVGSRYFRGALGYGGPCFPRDNKALSVAAESLGVSADIARATDVVNDRQVERVLQIVSKLCSEGEKILVLGLAYKEDTPVTESSQAFEIAKQLSLTRQVYAFDPLISEADLSGFENLKLLSRDDQFPNVRVALVAHPSLVERGMFSDDTIIVDLWGAITDGHSLVRPGKAAI